MSLYFRFYTNFWNHQKTRRLKSKLGNDALWIVPRLWSYAVENQSDGNFKTYSADDIAELLGYRGNAQIMLEALLEAGFMDNDMKIHDWDEHNGYHATYKERATKAATARWEKERTKEKKGEESETKREEMKRKERSNASSNACSINQEDSLRSVKPPPKPAVRFPVKIVASKPKTQMADDEFIASLKPLYEGIDVDAQIGKAKAWLLTPKGQRRKLTRTFLVNWLNRCDKPLSSSVQTKNPNPEGLQAPIL